MKKKPDKGKAGKLTPKAKELITDLIPDNKNYNKGNEKGGALIKKSITKLGAGRSILIDKNNRIIAGNKTVENAIASGLVELQIVETTGDKIIAVKRTDIDLDSKKGRELALADNATAKANIEWDDEALHEDWSKEELDDWGVVTGFETDLEAEEDDYEIPDVIETDIVLGDLFEIGRHRLLCGDSTDSDAVARLMGGKKADMIFTDPPYGVSYTGGIQFKNGTVKLDNQEMIKNDDKDIYADIIPMMAMICNGPIYTWFAGTKGSTIYDSIEKAGQIHSLIIWVKNGGFGALNANYKQKHEPCLYWKGKNGKLNFTGATNETTIWEIDKDGKNKMHPTQKPVALAARAIGNHSAGLITDLFLGSGSTMVACHQLNRICYGMELDPKYCQVIIDRMLKLDPNIEIKRNGKKYVKNSPKTAHEEAV